MRRTSVLISLLVVLPLATASPAHAAVPTIDSFTPDSGPVGTSVVISGTGFTGTTSVSFDGVEATFTDRLGHADHCHRACRGEHGADHRHKLGRSDDIGHELHGHDSLDTSRHHRHQPEARSDRDESTDIGGEPRCGDRGSAERPHRGLQHRVPHADPLPRPCEREERAGDGPQSRGHRYLERDLHGPQGQARVDHRLQVRPASRGARERSSVRWRADLQATTQGRDPAKGRRLVAVREERPNRSGGGTTACRYRTVPDLYRAIVRKKSTERDICKSRTSDPRRHRHPTGGGGGDGGGGGGGRRLSPLNQTSASHHLLPISTATT